MTPEAKERASAAKLRLRKEFADGGWCVMCGEREPMPGVKRCGLCCERDSDNKAAYRKRNRQAGKCRCGQAREDERWKLCAKCREAGRLHNARVRAKKI